ncbi:MAG: SDR family NAD(P)-dependent oxidoreductase [Candidatus Latescibacteria bacterium]|nr:SDR family NAD(P)-dependent oxidoreductase [bacterium]MBD3425187.1 SDR family NAD(P)-dependent oxidoreductase [Candidatus Latescibacterota bacterium]
MKIIITGATGFIGRNLAESLHDEGNQITATGRSRQVGNQLIKRGIEFTACDILDQDSLKSAFSAADLLIHCAGRTADRGSYSEFYQVNVVGTRNVIDACRQNDISRIIFISTPSVYYSGSDRFNVTESEPLPRKQFPYGKTKLIAEEELQSAAKEGISSIILRPRAVYGRYDGTIVPRILELSAGKKFPLINGGEAMVDITCIENLASAIRNCLAAPVSSWNQVYNISNGDPVSVREWFSTVLDIFNRPFRPKNIPGPLAYGFAGVMEFLSKMSQGRIKPAMTRFSVGYMSRSLTMSIEKARQKLGYRPGISNREGFLRYREWLEEQKESE